MGTFICITLALLVLVLIGAGVVILSVIEAVASITAYVVNLLTRRNSSDKE